MIITPVYKCFFAHEGAFYLRDKEHAVICGPLSEVQADQIVSALNAQQEKPQQDTSELVRNLRELATLPIGQRARTGFCSADENIMLQAAKRIEELEREAKKAYFAIELLVPDKFIGIIKMPNGQVYNHRAMWELLFAKAALTEEKND